jgi:hypothetical protein
LEGIIRPNTITTRDIIKTIVKLIDWPIITLIYPDDDDDDDNDNNDDAAAAA